MNTLAIVGGGYAGAVLAIQLSRHADRPYDIVVIEPRSSLGHGLAYGTQDPTHRLNGDLNTVSLYLDAYPEDSAHVAEWYAAQNLRNADPDSVCENGQVFMRRKDFGCYVAQEVARHMADNPSGSRIRHRQDIATGLERQPDGRYLVKLESGSSVPASAVFVTTSNEAPDVPGPFRDLSADHPAFIQDPWDWERLRNVAANGRVLVLGVAQTGSDVMAALLMQQHAGEIVALSRRGLRPRKWPENAPPSSQPLPERLRQNISVFSQKHGTPRTVLQALRAARSQARNDIGQGGSWLAALADIRDSLWEIWPDLPLVEKRRFFRHVRPWYDVHRFRLAPQVETPILEAEENGQLRFLAASVSNVRDLGHRLAVTIRPRGTDVTTEELFDCVVNCTGPSLSPSHSKNPFLQSILERRDVSEHATGFGFAVDDSLRAVAADGTADRPLFIVGPLTYGRYLDQQGGLFITDQIVRKLPGILSTLAKN